MNIIDDVKSVYSRIEDDASKFVFTNRLLYTFTGDMSFIRNIVEAMSDEFEIYKKMVNCNSPIGIFGAGVVGSSLVRTYNNLPIKCFIDNKKSGSLCENLPVITLMSLKKFIPKVLLSYQRSYFIRK